MLMALPVTLEIADNAGGTFKESTQTIVINRSGAKVLATASLPIGTRLTLSVGSGKGQRITPATVVWLGERRGSKSEVGLEIEQADGTFWGVLFPDDSGSFPPGSFSAGGGAKPKIEPDTKVAPAPAPVATQVPSSPAATAASQTLQPPAQTLPAKAPEFPALSEPETPGVPSSALAESLSAAKQELDGHVAKAVEQARERINDSLRQALAATLDPAVHAAKNDLIRLSAQYSQSAQKGVEGISKAAERTIAAVEQRSLQSALNTQMVVEQRLQMRLQECETVLASIEQQAAIKLDERVQAYMKQSEGRWKQALDKMVQERMETQLDAMQASLMVTAQQVLETQMEEFAHRLQSLAESFAQDLADRSLAPTGPLAKKAATH